MTEREHKTPQERIVNQQQMKVSANIHKKRQRIKQGSGEDEKSW